MNTSSSEADSASSDEIENREEVASKWVVRLFLILAFGLAFGIEGMTLIRSYLLVDDEETQEQVDRELEERGEEASPLRVGDDVLPATDVTEQVTEMKIQGRSDEPWVFRLVVTVINDGDSAYRLSLRELEADDGTRFDDVFAAECAPGDSTRLVATWPIGADARPLALSAEAKVRETADSARTVRRRRSFGHVPVQMER